MRTTINLDPQLVNEVMKTTGERDRGRAVNRALEEYVRRAKIEKLIALAGHIEFEDHSDEWRAAELEKMKKQHDHWRR